MLKEKNTLSEIYIYYQELGCGNDVSFIISCQNEKEFIQ